MGRRSSRRGGSKVCPASGVLTCAVGRGGRAGRRATRLQKVERETERDPELMPADGMYGGGCGAGGCGDFVPVWRIRVRAASAR